MFIEYLHLKNFSMIYTAFNSYEIKIDFTNSRNRIILISGPNGSGKTSILSCLHPFATNGTLDVRNDLPLILQGEEGYKEIHIRASDHTYEIKHFYLVNKDSHSVKSYIFRDGEDLNPNGNVTSFKEIVADELDIEMDYLKLARLGNNVTNFIDLKTTDRKSFMGKILDELDIYMKYYKKITGDMRELKSVISHLVDKVTKLGITDMDDIEKIIKDLTKEIKKDTEQIDDLTGKLGAVEYQIREYDSLLTIKELLDVKTRELEKMKRRIEKKRDVYTSTEECSEEIDKLRDIIAKEESDLAVNQTSMQEKVSQLDKLYVELREINQELLNQETSHEIEEVNKMISDLKEKIEKRHISSQLAGYEPNYTKKDVERIIIMLDGINDILTTMYGLGPNPIKKAIEYIVENRNIHQYTESVNNSIKKNKLQAYSEYVYKELIERVGKPAVDCSNPAGCNVYRLYEELENLATEVPDVVVEDETFLKFTDMAYDSIQGILNSLHNEAETLDKLPDDVKEGFKLKVILGRIEKQALIYDKNLMYKLMSKVTEYELQQEDLEKLDGLKRQLKALEKSTNNNDYFKKKQKSVQDEIEELTDDVETLGNQGHGIAKRLASDKENMDELVLLKESFMRKDEVEESCNRLKTNYENLILLTKKKKELESELQTYQFHLNKVTKECNDQKYRLDSYHELSKELKQVNETYEELDLIKYALSPKEGIPLYIIDVYLSDIQDVTNDLLEVVYDDIIIKDFDINGDEFNIPYVKGGKTIKDVRYASDGERSFMSLALSFALIYKSISKYNIMMLDEIDGALDSKNRAKFLAILEKQMDMIDSEQIFVISHNDMFSMYPVDIINTKNEFDHMNELSSCIPIEIL